MAAQLASPILATIDEVEHKNRIRRLALFALFLICGTAVFVFGSK